MQHPEITVQSDDEDEVLSIGRDDYATPSFKMPLSPSLGAEMLINKQKVSSDVLSISSGRSKSSMSDSGEYTTDSGGGSDIESIRDDSRVKNFFRPSSSRSSGSSDGDDDDMSSIPDTPSVHNKHQDHNGGMSSRFSVERSRAESELSEKKEILYQMDRLESKGYRLPKKFTMQSDLEEMRIEFNRIVREKEVDASIRFQRKMMMAFVTGVEYLNTRFDPFDVRLDGWSEQVHDNINDYDDIFEELHDKYKGSGKKMAPEMRLLMSLSGSALMFHLTNNMFKQSNVPHVEDVLRSDPKLMKQFQQAAASRMSSSSAGQGGGAFGGGIFSMVSNLFGGGGGSPPQRSSPPPQQQYSVPPPPQQSNSQPQPRMQGPRNVEDIINVVNADIQNAKSQRYETLSVSDEEITSIIEDTADINGLMGATNSNKRRGGSIRRGQAPANTGNRRTLQL